MPAYEPPQKRRTSGYGAGTRSRPSSTTSSANRSSSASSANSSLSWRSSPANSSTESLSGVGPTTSTPAISTSSARPLSRSDIQIGHFYLLPGLNDIPLESVVREGTLGYGAFGHPVVITEITGDIVKFVLGSSHGGRGIGHIPQEDHFRYRLVDGNPPSRRPGASPDQAKRLELIPGSCRYSRVRKPTYLKVDEVNQIEWTNLSPFSGVKFGLAVGLTPASIVELHDAITSFHP